LKESKSPILFLFVGDGPEKDHIVAMAKKKKLDDMCVFLGRRNDVSDLLQASDLLVLPSIKEGLPVTVVEAQAVGLPCLISDSITREVNIGNVMFSELDSNKWSNLICQLNILSDDERKARSESFNLSKFNIFHESRRVEQLYLKMVERDEK